MPRTRGDVPGAVPALLLLNLQMTGSTSSTRCSVQIRPWPSDGEHPEWVRMEKRALYFSYCRYIEARSTLEEAPTCK